MQSPGPASNGSYASPRFVTWRERDGRKRVTLAFGTTPELTTASVLRWKRGYKKLRYALAAARRGEAEAGPVVRAWRTRVLQPDGRLSAAALYRWAETWREAADRAAHDPGGRNAVTEECDPIEALAVCEPEDLEFHMRCLFGMKGSLRKRRCPPPQAGMAHASKRELARFCREAALQVRLAMLLPDYTDHRVRRGLGLARGIATHKARETLVRRHGEKVGTTLVNQCVNEGLRPLITIFTPKQDELLREVAARYGYEPVDKLSQLQLAVIWTRGEEAGQSWLMRRQVLSG